MNGVQRLIARSSCQEAGKLGCQDAGRLGGNQEFVTHSSLLILQFETINGVPFFFDYL